jgi:hypothetical protein
MRGAIEFAVLLMSGRTGDTGLQILASCFIKILALQQSIFWSNNVDKLNYSISHS